MKHIHHAPESCLRHCIEGVSDSLGNLVITMNKCKRGSRHARVVYIVRLESPCQVCVDWKWCPNWRHITTILDNTSCDLLLKITPLIRVLSRCTRMLFSNEFTYYSLVKFVQICCLKLKRICQWPWTLVTYMCDLMPNTSKTCMRQICVYLTYLFLMTQCRLDRLAFLVCGLHAWRNAFFACWCLHFSLDCLHSALVLTHSPIPWSVAAARWWCSWALITPCWAAQFVFDQTFCWCFLLCSWERWYYSWTLASCVVGFFW